MIGHGPWFGTHCDLDLAERQVPSPVLIHPLEQRVTGRVGRWLCGANRGNCCEPSVTFGIVGTKVQLRPSKGITSSTIGRRSSSALPSIRKSSEICSPAWPNNRQRQPSDGGDMSWRSGVEVLEHAEQVFKFVGLARTDVVKVEDREVRPLR